MVAFAFFAAFVALTAVFEGNTTLWTAFDNLGELLAAVLATAACAIRARRERSLYCSVRELRQHRSVEEVQLQRQTRSAWSLLTLGVGAWAAGQIGWTVYEVLLHVMPPTPSVLDGLFLTSSILIIAGLLAMCTPRPGISRTCAARAKGCSSRAAAPCSAGA